MERIKSNNVKFIDQINPMTITLLDNHVFVSYAVQCIPNKMYFYCPENRQGSVWRFVWISLILPPHAS